MNAVKWFVNEIASGVPKILPVAEDLTLVAIITAIGNVAFSHLGETFVGDAFLIRCIYVSCSIVFPLAMLHLIYKVSLFIKEQCFKKSHCHL